MEQEEELEKVEKLEQEDGRATNMKESLDGGRMETETDDTHGFEEEEGEASTPPRSPRRGSILTFDLDKNLG